MRFRLFKRSLPLSGASAVALALVAAPLVLASRAEARSTPRCLEGPRHSLYLEYNAREKYERKVYGALLPGSCNGFEGVLAADLFVDLDSPAGHDIQARLNSEQARYLEQVRNGADELHEESSGTAYLKNHPLANFTKDIDRNLTRRFGNGFAGEIYQAWIESQPQNARAKDLVFKNMTSALSDPRDAAKLSKRFEDTVVLVSMGLDWSDDVEPTTPWYVKNFVNDMKGLGINARFLKRNALGTIGENVRALIPQIQAALKENRRVILVGLCKGTPEALLALSNVLGSNPELESKFTGLLNLSGMMGPVYFADSFSWLTSLKSLQSALNGFPYAAIRHYAGYDHALTSMTSASMGPVVQDILATLPQNAVYLNVAGVLDGNGLLKTDTTAMGPFYVMNRKLHLAQGANDGFLEYPDNVIPNGHAPMNYSVVVNGSHMLTDGSLGPYSLLQAKNRVAAYRAFFETLMDLAGEK